MTEQELIDQMKVTAAAVRETSQHVDDSHRVFAKAREAAEQAYAAFVSAKRDLEEHLLAYPVIKTA